LKIEGDHELLTPPVKNKKLDFSKELSEVVHNISLINVHPKYNPDDITNDIAVLEVRLQIFNF
jgi:hypothetical protein